MTDYGTLRVDGIVLHQVPQSLRDKTKEEPLGLSEVEADLNDSNRAFLTERLRRALTQARPVREEPEEASPLPDLIKELLRGAGDLVPDSQQMASHLLKVQPLIAPTGLLVVARCTVEAQAAVVLAKLEHEQGMRVEQSVNENGQRTFNMTYLRDLIFSNAAQVYKIAAFLKTGISAENEISGDVADDQNGRRVADYFVGNYLGCVFTERPEVLTQRFFEAASRAINRVSDPSNQARYEVALIAEMQKSARTFNPLNFLRDYIDDVDQDMIRDRLVQANVPLRQTRKDTQLINSSIVRIKIETKRNATVLVPPDLYDDESLQIRTLANGKARIELTDEVTKTSGAAGRRSKPETPS